MSRIEELREDVSRTLSELAEIEERNGGLAARADWDPGQVQRFDNLTRRARSLDAEIAQIETRDEKIETRSERVEQVRAAAMGAGNLEHTDPTRGTSPATGVSSRALRLVDDYHRSGDLADDAAEKMERLLRNSDSSSPAADYVQTVGNPAYLSAFTKLLRDPARGDKLWTGEELAAYQAAEAWSKRASMSTTAANGGYLIPLTLDPTVILTSAGSINPLRQIARTVETMTGQWKGISSAGTSMEWKVEGAQAADGSFTVDDEPIPVHFGSVYVEYSFEIEQDGANFVREVQRVMVDAVEQGQNTAYTTGSGVGEPTGIITALSTTAGSKVAPTVAESFTAPDVYKVQNDLGPRFQGRAQWCAALPTINTIAQFETTNGALKFPELGDGRLLRRPINELSNMDSTYDPAATADNYILLYGDFSNFVIVDQVGGSRIELIPNVVGANGRPTGERGLFLWHRSGSDSVNDAAFRVLNVATTA